MKLSKSVIITFMILLVIESLQIFFLRPLIQDLYLYDDLLNFKYDSWKYSLVISIVVLMVVGFYAIKRNVFSKGFSFYAAILLFFFYFISESSMNSFMLYLNSKINIESTKKTYTVSRYDANKIFIIYDKKDIIFSSSELEKIDSMRLRKNQKSLFELRDKDTLNVDYKMGFLKVKFLNLNN